MRISDWSSDVCSSDLLDMLRGVANDQQRNLVTYLRIFHHQWGKGGIIGRRCIVHPSDDIRDSMVELLGHRLTELCRPCPSVERAQGMADCTETQRRTASLVCNGKAVAAAA